MIEFFKKWVTDIVTFSIFLIIIEMIIPSGKIKKFVQLFSGFILVIILINPFLKVFGGGVDLKDFQILNDTVVSKSELNYQSKVLEKHRKEMIAKVYKQKLRNYIETSIKDFNEIDKASITFKLNENASSEKFGDIEKICVYLKLKNKNEQARPVIKINKVDIKTNKTPELNKALKDKIQNKIATRVGIDVQKIEIIQKNVEEEDTDECE